MFQEVIHLEGVYQLSCYLSVPIWESGGEVIEGVGGVGTTKAREIRRLCCSATAVNTMMIEKLCVLSDDTVSRGADLGASDLADNSTGVILRE